MEYKKFIYPSFNLYTVKTNRFKTCQMEIIFKSEADRKDVMLKTFLADIMSDCSSKYHTRKDVARTMQIIKKIDKNRIVIVTNSREVLGLGFKEELNQ